MKTHPNAVPSPRAGVRRMASTACRSSWPLALLSASVLMACGGGNDAVAPKADSIVFATHTLASTARPAGTPGSAGVVVAPGSKLAVQFGSTEVNLNNVRYTRYQSAARQSSQPDAILVAVPGTLAASHSYLVLAENLIQRMYTDHGLVVELWGVDRRSVQLQDMVGLDIAERERDPTIGLDFLFGTELGLPLSPKLTRRAVFYDQAELSFIGNWTPQVHSIDIDAVVERARSVARNNNVFLGGHSAGTGFVARYAATNFDLSNSGPVQAGYAKLRGLVLFEGVGTGLAAAAPTEAQLDAVIAAADGGLAAAIAERKTNAYTAFAIPASLSASASAINPRTNASTELTGMQIAFENTVNGTQAWMQRDQGGVAGNNAYIKISGFKPRDFLVTAGAAIGTFMDDESTPDRTQFYSISMGAKGPVRVDGLTTWLDNDQALPDTAYHDFKPMLPDMPFNAETGAPLPLPAWGKSVEPTNLLRLSPAFFAGGTTWSDWYYPSSGLTIGNAAPRGTGGADLGLDTSKLSLPVAQGGRGRSDIVNQTQARNINIPVIGFGGSNGLATVPGAWRAFAEAIAPCATPSCTAGTVRTPAGQALTVANRAYGDVAGGFEVHISEGYTHVDVLTANDIPSNKVVRPLSDFIARNVRR